MLGENGDQRETPVLRNHDYRMEGNGIKKNRAAIRKHSEIGEAWIMTIPCPICGEQIDAEDAKIFDMKLNRDSFRNFFPDGYFSKEGIQTVAKAEANPTFQEKRQRSRKI